MDRLRGRVDEPARRTLIAAGKLAGDAGRSELVDRRSVANLAAYRASALEASIQLCEDSWPTLCRLIMDLWGEKGRSYGPHSRIPESSAKVPQACKLLSLSKPPGVASSQPRQMLPFGFEQPRLQRIEVRAMAGNRAGRLTAEISGARFERIVPVGPRVAGADHHAVIQAACACGQ